MFRSQLTNQVCNTRTDLREHYKEFFLGIRDDVPYVINGNLWQGFRLVVDQYVRARAELQAVRDPNDIARWINANQHRLFNVPLIHAGMSEAGRKPEQFIRFEFASFKEDDDVDARFYFGNVAAEEDVEGKGYSGDLRIYIPYTTKPYDEPSVRWALASFGIYITEQAFSNDDEGRFIDASFVMLERDWSFDVELNIWVLETRRWDRPSSLMTNRELEDFLDEEFEKLSEGEKSAHDFEERIKWIEDGLLDDEDPRI